MPPSQQSFLDGGNVSQVAVDPRVPNLGMPPSQQSVLGWRHDNKVSSDGAADPQKSSSAIPGIILSRRCSGYQERERAPWRKTGLWDWDQVDIVGHIMVATPAFKRANILLKICSRLMPKANAQG